MQRKVLPTLTTAGLMDDQSMPNSLRLLTSEKPVAVNTRWESVPAGGSATSCTLNPSPENSADSCTDVVGAAKGAENPDQGLHPHAVVAAKAGNAALAVAQTVGVAVVVAVAAVIADQTVKMRVAVAVAGVAAGNGVVASENLTFIMILRDTTQS